MPEVITLPVPGMTYGTCQRAVEGAVCELAGVSAATVDLGAAGTVTVTYDAPAQRAGIETAIAHVGYEVAGAPRGSSS
jgi:copper chaperone CopZ